MAGKRERIIALLAGILAAVFLSAGSALADRVVTLSFTGDCTIGSEEKYRDREDSFDSLAEKYGYGYFFRNFRDLFSADDCTVINLEGVLSDTKSGEKDRKYYRFRGPEKFVGILTDGSVELAGIANNHIADFSARGMDRTIGTLESAGIGWARATTPYVLEKDGIRIYFFAMDYSLQNQKGKTIRKTIIGLKESGEANAVVVMYHNGNEYDARHSSVQAKVGDFYIDAGADLVIMHHPHVVQGIQVRNNRTIFYSLGNFIFGGNREIRTNNYQNIRTVSSLYTMAVQVKMHFSDDGRYLGQQAVLYPAYTSSAEPANNFQPVRMTVEQTEPVTDAILFDTPQTELPAATEDEDGYARIIMPYLDAGNGLPAEENTAGKPETPAARPGRDSRQAE